jgi:hypothetical protein
MNNWLACACVPGQARSLAIHNVLCLTAVTCEAAHTSLCFVSCTARACCVAVPSTLCLIIARREEREVTCVFSVCIMGSPHSDNISLTQQCTSNAREPLAAWHSHPRFSTCDYLHCATMQTHAHTHARVRGHRIACLASSLAQRVRQHICLGSPDNQHTLRQR